MGLRSTHRLYDPFGKDVAAALLESAGGRVEREVPVDTESQALDLWYEPLQGRPPAGVTGLAPGPLGSSDTAAGPELAELPALALLAHIAREPFALELFTNAPRTGVLLGCARKQLNWAHARSRSRQGWPLDRAVSTMWVVCAERPRKALHVLDARPLAGWPPGFYAVLPPLPLGLVAVTELPEAAATWPLRLLGRGKTLQRALADRRALPEDAVERAAVLRVIARWRRRLLSRMRRSADEEAFVMTTDEDFEEWERRVEARGEARAKAEDVLAVLAARGLEVPDAVRERVQGCTDLAQLDAWLVGAAKVERAEDIFEAG